MELNGYWLPKGTTVQVRAAERCPPGLPAERDCCSAARVSQPVCSAESKKSSVKRAGWLSRTRAQAECCGCRCRPTCCTWTRTALQRRRATSPSAGCRTSAQTPCPSSQVRSHRQAACITGQQQEGWLPQQPLVAARRSLNSPAQAVMCVHAQAREQGVPPTNVCHAHTPFAEWTSAAGSLGRPGCLASAGTTPMLLPQGCCCGEGRPTGLHAVQAPAQRTTRRRSRP